MASLVISFLIALIALIVSGRLLVKFIARAAQGFGISEYSAAFVLLAVATSIPELSVAISSARQGATDLIFAVVLGSNVINSSLVVGLAAFLSVGISTITLNLRRDVVLGTGLIFLPLLFMSDGTINSFEGALLLVSFAYYVVLLYRDRTAGASGDQKLRWRQGLASAAAALVAVAVLMYSSDVVVTATLSIAKTAGIHPAIIGVLAIALGTSLPELITAVHAALERKPGLALGNIIGSNIANATLILGLASFISPLSVALSPFLLISIAFVVVATLTLSWFVASNKGITFRESLVQITIFFLYGAATLLTGLAQ